MIKNVKSVLASLIAPEHSWKMELFHHWPTIIGKLASVVNIEKVEKETLFLTVHHPAWAQELSLLTPVLLEKIKELLPTSPIKTIRCSFKIKQRNAIQKTRPPQAAYVQMPTPSLSPQEEKVLASLADQELQLTLATYFKRCKALKGRS